MGGPGGKSEKTGLGCGFRETGYEIQIRDVRFEMRYMR